MTTPDLYQTIVSNIPALQRGMVWCKTCKRSERADFADCLRNGWPRCHGETMTIDPPETWEEPPKCDGNHGGPKCTDPECWHG